LRPVQLFEKVRTRRIDESEIRAIDPEGWTFFNMNTPEDYAKALSRWRDIRAGSGAVQGDDRVSCTVELFGVARMLSHTREIPMNLPAGATLSQVYAELAERLPVLVGRVISHSRNGLVDGYACNVNGLEFVRDSNTPVQPGDSILILAADAGG
jgi:molybdopterin converting factor small subunit